MDHAADVADPCDTVSFVCVVTQNTVILALAQPPVDEPLLLSSSSLSPLFLSDLCLI